MHSWREPKILNTILDHVGNTPLVRINKIAEKAGLKCDLLAKCEFFNAGGSVKDRIGKRMIEDAIASGRIKPGATTLHLSRRPHAHHYTNPSNPLAHYDQTAEEILESCGGVVDMLVISAGTGGTITGTAKKIKEKCPSVVVVGVDPQGSILALPDTLNDHNRLKSYEVEGIGYDFIPEVLHRDVVDKWIKTNDQDSFVMARRMIREEGLLCGGSCGSAMAAAVIAAKDLLPGQKCVVMLPDSTRNYMTKFLSDDWMYDHGYVQNLDKKPANQAWWAKKFVSELPLNVPYTITASLPCKEAVDILKAEGFDNLPVVDEHNAIVGVISEGNLTAQLLPGRILPSDPVSKAMYKQFKKVSTHTTLSELSRIFDKDHFALVVTEQRRYSAGGIVETKSVIFGVVTRIDLLTFITAKE
ncbi:hypothetical protein DYB35_009573 [Aphanomyces astaci]|uniref:CBS domain-containing protein n=1 Tax=Aphanomyces astaci TaxID=112090 RepID=A0A418DJB1_APHAT|nr:hypothetical protein DYB35_009573 [Aphanomyces astaci]